MYVDIDCTEDVDEKLHGFVCSDNCLKSYHYQCQGFLKVDGILHSGMPLQVVHIAPTECSYCRYEQQLHDLGGDIDMVPMNNIDNEQECLAYFQSLSREQQALRMGMDKDATAAAVNAVFKFLKGQESKVLLNCLMPPVPYHNHNSVAKVFEDVITRAGRKFEIAQQCISINTCACCGCVKVGMNINRTFSTKPPGCRNFDTHMHSKIQCILPSCNCLPKFYNPNNDGHPRP